MRKNCDIIKDIIPMYATKIKGYGIIVADLDDKADITPCLESFTSMGGNHVYIKIEETNT